MIKRGAAFRRRQRARVADAPDDAAITTAAALGLSQEAFAARQGIPVATPWQWEPGCRLLDRAALSYLRVITSLPEAVAAARAAACAHR